MSRFVSWSSAPCGSGKTFRMGRSSCRMVNEAENVLLIQPTQLLADKTFDEEFTHRQDCPPIKVFHGGTVGQGVGRQLADYLANPGDCPQVVMATHQALPYIPYFPTADNWHLMIDECLQVDRCRDHDVRKTHNFITEHIRIDQFNSIYGRVKVTNLEEMEKLARNPDGDELLDKLRETAGILINPHWRSYVNIEQYNKLIHGKVNKLTFHSLLQPTIINGFASVFMAGANLEDSGVYHLWGNRASGSKKIANSPRD